MKYNTNESLINTGDVKGLFKTAVQLRSSPSGLGRVFKGLRKDTIDFQDLVDAWTTAGRPDDTADVASILKDFGFGDKEIKKVFAQTFGKAKTDAGYEEPVASEAVQKIANYAKENDIVAELKTFLEKEYKFNESSQYQGKLITEDIGKVFKNILKEERSGRDYLLKQQEKEHLGRNKK